MDRINMEERVKRICQKSSSSERFGELVNNEDYSLAISQDDAARKKQRNDYTLVPMNNSSSEPFMLRLLPVPNLQVSSPSSPVVLNGTAKQAVPGPRVGAVDIGISKSAYYFRVAVPGVKKDPGQFSCVIERDGRVNVRGVTTTGSATILRHARVHKMKFQQLCLPGPFTLSFSLPGPVDPRRFSPNFHDGIFEGVVVKLE